MTGDGQFSGNFGKLLLSYRVVSDENPAQRNFSLIESRLRKLAIGSSSALRNGRKADSQPEPHRDLTPKNIGMVQKKILLSPVFFAQRRQKICLTRPESQHTMPRLEYSLDCGYAGQNKTSEHSSGTVVFF
jgi:hypothetical protein